MSAGIIHLPARLTSSPPVLTRLTIPSPANPQHLPVQQLAGQSTGTPSHPDPAGASAIVNKLGHVSRVPVFAVSRIPLHDQVPPLSLNQHYCHCGEDCGRRLFEEWDPVPRPPHPPSRCG